MTYYSGCTISFKVAGYSPEEPDRIWYRRLKFNDDFQTNKSKKYSDSLMFFIYNQFKDTPYEVKEFRTVKLNRSRIYIQKEYSKKNFKEIREMNKTIKKET